VRVDLTSWQVEETSLQALMQAGADPIALARSWLASPGEVSHKAGIDKLVASCGELRAAALLGETVKAHPQATMRALAAAALATCHDARVSRYSSPPWRLMATRACARRLPAPLVCSGREWPGAPWKRRRPRIRIPMCGARRIGPQSGSSSPPLVEEVLPLEHEGALVDQLGHQP
jgi:hypothetical protein